MNEPPVRYWVMGENKWRTGRRLAGARDRLDAEYYLHSWEKLNTKGHLPATDTYINEPPDAFVQMPPIQTNTIERLRYMTEPLAEDTLVAGPISLTLLRLARRGRHQLDRDPQGRGS
jgi:hypothetical protein